MKDFFPESLGQKPRCTLYMEAHCTQQNMANLLTSLCLTDVLASLMFTIPQRNTFIYSHRNVNHCVW